MVNGLIKVGYQTLYLEERMCYLHHIQNLRISYQYLLHMLNTENQESYPQQMVTSQSN